ESIKVGAGGILLPQYSAYKVAAQISQLESLYPGRIEAGVGRSTGGGEVVRKRLADFKPDQMGDYPEKLEALAGYLNKEGKIRADRGQKENRNSMPSDSENTVRKWLQHSASDMYSDTSSNQTGAKKPLKHTTGISGRCCSDLRRRRPVSSSSAASTTNMHSLRQPPSTSAW